MLPWSGAVAKQTVLLAGVLAHAVFCRLGPCTSSSLANEASQNWLVPPSKGLLPPKQMVTNLSVLGSKHAHQAEAPNKICLLYMVSPHPKAGAHQCVMCGAAEELPSYSNFGTH